MRGRPRSPFLPLLPHAPVSATRPEPGTTSGRRDSAFKAELAQIEAVDERIDDPHQSIQRDVVVDAGREQTDLGAAFTFDEAHRTYLPKAQNQLILQRFD
jgi:hypothetical protein